MPKVAIFADIIKLFILLIKATFKDSIKVKKIEIINSQFSFVFLNETKIVNL